VKENANIISHFILKCLKNIYIKIIVDGTLENFRTFKYSIFRIENIIQNHNKNIFSVTQFFVNSFLQSA